MLLALLTACSPTTLRFDEATRDEPARGVEDLGAVDDPDTGGDDTGDPNAPFPLDDEGCPSFYAQDFVPEIALDLEPDELDALEQDRRSYAQNYHPARFTYEGETWDAMVRIRGNTWVAKYELSISFNEVDPEGRFHGLRKVTLDGASYETTMLRNRIAAWWLRRQGVPAYCANNVRLVLNGTYFGLYSNTEDIDHEFLERNFPDDFSGTLYKEGSEAKSNADAAISDHLLAWQGATDPDVLADSLDIDQVMHAWAAEAVLPNTDGFVYGLHNYYLYDDPAAGFVHIPSDLDFSFDGSQALDVQPYTVDPLTYARVGNGAQFLLFRNDPEWQDRYVAEIAEVVQVMDVEGLNGAWQEWSAQIEDSLAEDPNRTFDMQTHAQHVADVQTFLLQRLDFMEQWVLANAQ